MTATGRVLISPSLAVKTAVLLIGCGFCLSALAASNSLVECDEMSQGPQDLDIPTQPLTASKVDHFLVPPADAVDTSPDVDPQAIAPILSLTPRVLSILDQVFDTDVTTDVQTDHLTSKPESSESASPVADRVYGQSDIDASTAEELKLPQIQQQMYRKDI